MVEGKPSRDGWGGSGPAGTQPVLGTQPETMPVDLQKALDDIVTDGSEQTQLSC